MTGTAVELLLMSEWTAMPTPILAMRSVGAQFCAEGARRLVAKPLRRFESVDMPRRSPDQSAAGATTLEGRMGAYEGCECWDQPGNPVCPAAEHVPASYSSAWHRRARAGTLPPMASGGVPVIPLRVVTQPVADANPPRKAGVLSRILGSLGERWSRRTEPPMTLTTAQVERRLYGYVRQAHPAFPSAEFASAHQSHVTTGEEVQPIA